jgi:hypothetical protein
MLLFCSCVFVVELLLLPPLSICSDFLTLRPQQPAAKDEPPPPAPDKPKPKRLITKIEKF